MAPLERVNLSGVDTVLFLSSTCAWMAPPALRSGAASGTEGAAVASLPRKSLKSLLWAITVWVASGGAKARACSSVGIVKTAPALRRFKLPLTKASALLRSSAASIWSSDTWAGLVAAAILLAVSPAFTVTRFSPSLRNGFGTTSVADTAAALRAVGAGASAARAVGPAGATAGAGIAAAAGTWGAATGAGAVARMLGGSRSMV